MANDERNWTDFDDDGQLETSDQDEEYYDAE